jgi:peptidylprolyl isomerase
MRRITRLTIAIPLLTLVLAACSGAPALKSEDLIVGPGREARPGDYVFVNYVATLADGTQFDSTLLHGNPDGFVLGSGRMVVGLEQGIAGMQVGGKRRLTVPPELGYGAQGAFSGKVPPNATLIYVVDLVDVQPGVTIETLAAGSGRAALPGDTVVVQYTGWLSDGTKFDSSLDHGQPFQFKLGAKEVIEGWDIGITGMKVGGKRRLTIPPYLAYGQAGAGGVIPPNATLVFEVELLQIVNP